MVRDTFKNTAKLISIQSFAVTKVSLHHTCTYRCCWAVIANHNFSCCYYLSLHIIKHSYRMIKMNKKRMKQLKGRQNLYQEISYYVAVFSYVYDKLKISSTYICKFTNACWPHQLFCMNTLHWNRFWRVDVYNNYASVI